MSDTAQNENPEAAEPPEVETRTYEVELSVTVYTSVTVEAEDEDEAHALAKQEAKYADWDDQVLFVTVDSVKVVEP